MKPIKTSQVWPDAQDTGAVGGGTSLLYKVPVKLVDNGMVGMVSNLGWIREKNWKLVNVLDDQMTESRIYIYI